MKYKINVCRRSYRVTNGKDRGRQIETEKSCPFKKNEVLTVNSTFTII